jgi:hypothetical protein
VGAGGAMDVADVGQQPRGAGRTDAGQLEQRRPSCDDQGGELFLDAARRSSSLIPVTKARKATLLRAELTLFRHSSHGARRGRMPCESHTKTPRPAAMWERAAEHLNRVWPDTGPARSSPDERAHPARRRSRTRRPPPPRRCRGHRNAWPGATARAHSSWWAWVSALPDVDHARRKGAPRPSDCNASTPRWRA